MRIAISNIAWDVSEDETIAALLRRFQVDAIDIAPGKYFADFQLADERSIAQVRTTWEARGIEITGMQALMFGTHGLNMFGLPETQNAMLRHLAAASRIGAELGATRLVFGAPKNRDRSGLGDDETDDIAVNFFTCLGEVAQSMGVVFCLEANPASYGCNFMTSTDEAARIVRLVNHPAIRLHLDTGTLTINAESPSDMVHQHAQLIGHIHASEPDLLTLGDSSTRHDLVAAALHKFLPHHVVSIEMLAAKNESHEVAVTRALQIATRHYRTAQTEAEVQR
ncbi:MAG TPA: TIM barrel protein [Gallionella sp.]|nr:TIM barrel protein [Gallionella sp.]